MSEEPKSPTKKDLVDAYKSGDLASHVFDRFGSVDSAALAPIIKDCVELHNAGEIDLLSLAQASILETVETGKFFLGQDFFCKAIPKLNAATEDMMRCVQALVDKGGEDLAADWPNGAFREWCAVDLRRVQDVIGASKDDDALAIRFLVFALVAGNMAEEAKGLIAQYSDERRLSGITALGRVNYARPDQARAAISALASCVETEPNDHHCANVLMSALEIVRKTDQIASCDIFGIIERVSEAAGPLSLMSCARALGEHHKSLSKDAVGLLLRTLDGVDPSQEGILRELDSGLSALLDTPFASDAIEFMASLLRSSENAPSLSEFEQFSRKLVNLPESDFCKVLIAWFRSGERSLCDGLNKALRKCGQGNKPLDVPIQDFDLSPDEQFFLCRKAIGYLFDQPITAGSILVAVLRVCSDSVADNVRDLLFDPLLLNYGGGVRNYLSLINKDDPAYPHVQIALEHSKQYLEGLKSAGEIKELHPSGYQRQIEHLRVRDQMQEAYKQAEKQSVLFDLVTRSVILYGKKSVTFVDGPEGELRPVETELKAHGTSVEIPRGAIIDPFGIDYLLRIFRAERPKS